MTTHGLLNVYSKKLHHNHTRMTRESVAKLTPSKSRYQLPEFSNFVFRIGSNTFIRKFQVLGTLNSYNIIMLTLTLVFISSEPQDWNHKIETTRLESQDWNHKIGTTRLEPQDWNHKIGTTRLEPKDWNHKIGTTRLEPQDWNHKIETTRLEPQDWNHMIGTTRLKPHDWNHKIETTWLEPQDWNHKIGTTRLEPQDWNHKIGTTRLKPQDWNHKDWNQKIGTTRLEPQDRNHKIGTTRLEPQDWNHKIGTTRLEPQDWNHKIGTTRLEPQDSHFPGSWCYLTTKTDCRVGRANICDIGRSRQTTNPTRKSKCQAISRCYTNHVICFHNHPRISFERSSVFKVLNKNEREESTKLSETSCCN